MPTVGIGEGGSEGVWFAESMDHSNSPNVPEIWFEFEPLPNITNYDIYKRS